MVYMCIGAKPKEEVRKIKQSRSRAPELARVFDHAIWPFVP